MTDLQVVHDLDKLAKLCDSEIINDITHVTATPNHDVLPFENNDLMILLDNGELLTSDGSSEGMITARKAQQYYRNQGIDVSIRPAESHVVAALHGASESNVNSFGTGGLDSDDMSDQDRTHAQRQLDMLIQASFQAGSSDVHIETDNHLKTSRIRFRIRKKLIDQTAPNFRMTHLEGASIGWLIVNYEAHASGGTSPKPFDANSRNDASFNVSIQVGGRKRNAKVRYSHMPTDDPKGLNIVMRLVSTEADGKILSFQELGYNPLQTALQERAFMSPHGLILYVGPTGSGKTTAMGAGISMLPKSQKIIAFEDPCEISHPNVSQTQINNKRPEMTLEGCSTGAMRLDPDSLVYGEMREKSFQDRAFEQANTGHLVLSTLHSNSATGAIERMTDLGADPTRLASPGLIRLIVAQRLTLKVCPSCCVSLESVVHSSKASVDQIRIFHHFEKICSDRNHDIKKIKIAPTEGTHCNQCNSMGSSGLMPIVEIIYPDKEGRKFIRKLDIDGWIDYLKNAGWKSMEDDAVEKILRGVICPVHAESELESPFGINTDCFDYNEFDKELLEREREKTETLRNLVSSNKPSITRIS